VPKLEEVNNEGIHLKAE